MTFQRTNPIGTLMVIDDSAVDQMIYERIVRKSGLVGQLQQFQDATKALDHLSDPNKRQPDLILLDVNMPQMDGFEFLEMATKKIGQNMSPVIVMLTTSLNPRDSERAKDFAILRDFLNKPLTYDHLVSLSGVVEAS